MIYPLPIVLSNRNIRRGARNVRDIQPEAV